MALTFGSLFAGVGGIDLGLERAGMVCRWQVEIDDYCRRVLAKHWPDVPKHDDVRTFPPDGFDASVDLIAGGFPCQDISNAGKRAGIEGERSGLWTEFARIIRVVRPRYVLVENVAALLGRGMGVVLGDLAESGYDAEWFCLPAAAVGAPHLRNRVFIVAYATDHWDGRREQQQKGCEGARHVADAECGGCEPGSGREGSAGEWRAEPSACREDLADAEGKRCGARRPRGTAAPGEGWNAEGKAVADSEGIGVEGDGTNRFSLARTPAKQRLLGRYRAREGASQWAVEPDVGRVVARISSRVDRLRGLGNAVVPQVAEFIGRLIVNADKEER